MHSKHDSWYVTSLSFLEMQQISKVFTPVDSEIPSLFSATAEITTFMIARFIAVVITAPAALVPGFLVGVTSALVGHVYLRAQLSIKREQSVVEAPIMGHFGSAMAGLGTYTTS